jgi:hypothetical protein
MIINFLFLVFIVYLIFIYNKLQNDKFLNLDTYLRHTSLIVERLEKENQILKEQNGSFETKIIKNDTELEKLNNNMLLKNKEINKLNKNYIDERQMNQSFTSIFQESEKNLYEQISELKFNSKRIDGEYEELKKENLLLKNKQEILFQFLKITDYEIYEELLKRI